MNHPANHQALPFPIGISQFTTRPWTFEQDVEHYAKLGVNMIEICEEKLDDQRYKEQMATVKASGLTISAIQPLVRTFGGSQMQPTPVNLGARVKRLRTSIERLAPFAVNCPFVVNTGAPENGNVDAMIHTTIRELRAIAEFAADHGVSLALEPLNATAMNNETCIWTITQALELIDSVNRDNVGLCLDLWNSWQDAHIHEEIRRAADRIFVLQVSDWRIPRAASDRLVPGDGIIPIKHLLSTVQTAGYTGACTVEIFSSNVPNALYDADLAEVIKRSKQGLENSWLQL